jgi:hypothetical protein
VAALLALGSRKGSGAQHPACTFLCCFVASSSGRASSIDGTGEIHRQLALRVYGERRGEVSNVQVKSVLHASPFSQSQLKDDLDATKG